MTGSSQFATLMDLAVAGVQIVMDHHPADAGPSDYNAGRQYGVWIDMFDGIDADDIADQVRVMVDGSLEPATKEWAIHYYQGFGGVAESFANVARIANAIAAGGACDTFGAQYVLEADDVAECITDRFYGVYDTRADWAADFLEGQIPDGICAQYFELDSYAADESGEFTCCDVTGGVATFSNR